MSAVETTKLTPLEHFYLASVIENQGYDPDKDVAVLKIDAPASALRPIPVGESGTVKVSLRRSRRGRACFVKRFHLGWSLLGSSLPATCGVLRPIVDVARTNNDLWSRLVPRNAEDVKLTVG